MRKWVLRICIGAFFVISILCGGAWAFMNRLADDIEANDEEDAREHTRLAEQIKGQSQQQVIIVKQIHESIGGIKADQTNAMKEQKEWNEKMDAKQDQIYELG